MAFDTWRDDDETRASFEKAAAILDAGFGTLLHQLSDAGLQVRESSLRSGRAPNFPFYQWQFRIWRDEDREGRIHRRAVNLSYTEPSHVGEEPYLIINIVADIFRVGAESDAARVIEERVPFGEVSTTEAFTTRVRAAVADADTLMDRVRKQGDRFEMVDPVLYPWAKSRSLGVQTKHRDTDVRSIEVVDDAGGRYQIWVDEVAGDEVEVRAWSPETGDRWRGRGPVADLAGLLENALAAANGWIQNRGRTRGVY